MLLTNMFVCQLHGRCASLNLMSSVLTFVSVIKKSVSVLKKSVPP
jgi:hypothetical protein